MEFYDYHVNSNPLIDFLTISPLNEKSILVSFGNRIDILVNRKVIALHRKLVQKSFEGFIESVPSYSSLAVFYDYLKIKSMIRESQTPFDFIKEFLQKMTEQILDEVEEAKTTVQLPVLYDGDDLDFVAQQHQLSQDELISIHAGKEYRVFMIGFLPGFPYMGSVDDRIATPRKSSPRTLVPAGSVGIAGIQTGIYPQSSPGGWQLIGRTPIKIFDRNRESPCLLQPGDVVKFYSISKKEFDKLNEY